MDPRNLIESIITDANNLADWYNQTFKQPTPVVPPPPISHNGDVLTPQSPIYKVDRADLPTIQRATSKYPINNVVPFIYSQSVKLGIDPVFAVAEAILETGWGSSNAAQVLHNWYGYMEFVSGVRSLKKFSSDTEGIDTAITDIYNNYCSPSGQFFDNGSGRTLYGWAFHWISGPTVTRDVNTIISIMQQLINA